MATRTQKTTYGCGNKTVTTKTKNKYGAVTKTKTKIVSGVKPRKPKSK